MHAVRTRFAMVSEAAETKIDAINNAYDAN